MAQVVHKHVLTGVDNLKLQPFARLIHVDRDTRNPDSIAVWFIVNDALPAENVRTFHIVGDGHPVPRYPAKHVGSVLMTPFIWHVFEENPP